MAGWFGKRKRQRQQNAALDAIMGAAQERGIPTMRVDDPDELAISLGLAQQQQGNLAQAEETFRLIAGDGRRAAPKASFYLGVVQQDRGDLAGAQASFRQALTASDPQVVAGAAVNLASLLVEQHEVAEAERLMCQAETTCPPYAARARFNLGCLLALQGRNQEAEASFHWVIDGRDRDEAPGAMTHLAALYFRTGRFEESERLYRQVLASGHREFTPLAAAGLADIQGRRGS